MCILAGSGPSPFMTVNITYKANKMCIGRCGGGGLVTCSVGAKSLHQAYYAIDWPSNIHDVAADLFTV